MRGGCNFDLNERVLERALKRGRVFIRGNTRADADHMKVVISQGHIVKYT